MEWWNTGTSSMSNPYLNLTIEESHFLDKFSTDNIVLIKKCVPENLLQARVGAYMGTMRMEDVLNIFGLTRKAQNFYHYKTMCSMPFFNELTTRFVN